MCWHEKKDRQSKPVTKVSNQLVNNVIGAMRSECYTRSEQRINSWIDNDGPDECVALRNGILNLSELFKTSDQPNETRILLPHTSNFFTTVCLPYEFDPAAKCPTWLNFLSTSFNEDRASIDFLQKWFGLMLTPITKFQKMLFVIGPARSGKGTIQRTLMAMLGRETVATPSVNDLAGQFTLHGMMDKTVAIISDARLSNRADGIAITERLLSITGEDPQDIQRKYMDTLHGVRMQVRFTLFSNMLPNLKDQSAAFITRTRFLTMPNSYAGREDIHLGDKLFQELPGILNWAIAGRFRLLESNKLEQPSSGMKLVNQMRMLISPVAAFINDQCDTEGEIEIRELYQAYCEWCTENDQSHKLDLTAFGKNVHNILPGVERMRSAKGSRPYVYRGISLKSASSTGF
jgi:putative DNA primase/helicase